MGGQSDVFTISLVPVFLGYIDVKSYTTDRPPSVLKVSSLHTYVRSWNINFYHWRSVRSFHNTYQNHSVFLMTSHPQFCIPSPINGVSDAADHYMHWYVDFMHLKYMKGMDEKYYQGRSVFTH